MKLFTWVMIGLDVLSLVVALAIGMGVIA